MQDAWAPSPSAVGVRETFSIGGALSRTAGVWGRNAPLFLGIALAINLPLLALPRWEPGTGLGTSLLAVLGVFVQTVLNFVVTGALTYAVVEQLSGRGVNARKILAVGFSRLGPLVGASIVTGILIWLWSLLLIVPGVIRAVRWILVAPVVIMEREDADSARARSETLTAGHRWGIFGLLLVLVVINLVLGAVAGAVFGVTGMLSFFVTKVLVVAVTNSFQAALYGVMYYQLRSEKEGIDIEQLAAVFD